MSRADPGFSRARLPVWPGITTGIDLTPAMLEQARALQHQQGLENLTWQEGDVLPLPYADHSFSIVSTRFAVHHFLDPLAVLKEMRRVSRPGGRVVVADSAPAANKADAFNRMSDCAILLTSVRCRRKSFAGCLRTRVCLRLAFCLTCSRATSRVCSRAHSPAKGMPIASVRYSPNHWSMTILAWQRFAATAKSASRSRP